MADSAGDTQIARVAFVVPDAALLLNEYNALARVICANGDLVRCFAPKISRSDAAELDKQGIHCTQFSLIPGGISLLPQRKATGVLAGLLAEWSATVVIAIGGMTLVRGVRAARKVKVGRIVAVVEQFPGADDGGFKGVEASPTLSEFKQALACANSVVCLNDDLLGRLKHLDLVGSGSDIIVVPRCGVDLSKFEETALLSDESGLVFHMSCPLEAENHFRAYCEAAALVKSQVPKVAFILSGPAGQSTDGTGNDPLETFGDAVTYSGDRLADIKDLARCHVFLCLSRTQSWPLVAMKALAMGRPVIASHCAASHELVDERVNGCLVDASSVSEIAEALQSYLRRPELIPSMARASRQKAVRRLAQSDAVAKLVPLLELNR